MPGVEKLCCPECKEKSTMGQGHTGNLINKTHELKGGVNSRFGTAVKKGDVLTYYHCKICNAKWDKSELETIETEWTTVMWTDPKTGELRGNRNPRAFVHFYFLAGVKHPRCPFRPTSGRGGGEALKYGALVGFQYSRICVFLLHIFGVHKQRVLRSFSERRGFVDPFTGRTKF